MAALVLGLAACADLRHRLAAPAPAAVLRQALASGGELAVEVESGFFFVRVDWPARRPETVLTVVIEGDGRAWLSRQQPAPEPTPRRALGLEIATIEAAFGPTLYLGRPGQYPEQAPGAACAVDYWTGRRFAPEVIAAAERAIGARLARDGLRALRLIGYSGGGTLAALVAARRPDVVELLTIAAPLDHRAWTAWHGVSPLAGSRNPVDAPGRLLDLPQRHFVGAADSVVPPELSRRVLAAMGARDAEVIEIEAAGHECCWVEDWPVLRRAAARPGIVRGAAAAEDTSR